MERIIIYTMLIFCIVLLINYIYTKEILRKHILKQIIKNNKLYCLYQPIIDLKTGSIYGYESLTRAYHSKYRNTKNLIDDVYKFNLIGEFTLLTIQNSINGFRGLEKDKYVFVNIDPKTLKQNFDEIYNFLKSLNIELREKIIIELTEYVQINDMKKLKTCLQNIRDLGIRIALDDFGVGYSNMDIRISIFSDFVKVDAKFIKDIDKEDKKNDLIKRIVDYNKYSKTKTICEGIETKEELETLIKLGVDYGQGYYLGKPCNIVK